MISSEPLPFFDTVGWILIHFVWQATLVGVGLWLSLALVPQKSPRYRYGISVAALLAICLCPLLTSIHLQNRETPSRRTTALAVVETTPAESPVSAQTHKIEAPHPKSEQDLAQQSPSSRSVAPFLPWLVFAWGLGMLVTNLRLIRSWLTLRHWRINAFEPVKEWTEKFDKLTARFPMNWNAKLLESSQIAVPMVIGWLKPIVLVPAGFMTSLPAQQIEAILLHELAHIYRNDVLVNLAQSIVESIFYFHPVVAWIGKQIRAERECCCDQLAAERCPSVLEYVSALSALEVQRRPGPANFQVAADGGSLLNRIRRLTVAPKKRFQLAPLFAFGLSIVIFITAYTGFAAPAQAEVQSQDESVELLDSPDVNQDGKPALLIRVLDADDDQPIDSFVVVAGVPIRSEMLDAQFLKLFPDAKLANWQSHTAQMGENGELVQSLARAYDPLCLRIESDGYVPQQYLSVDKSRGSQTIIFRMKKDPGLKGQVLLPNGKPAANALVGIGMTSRQLQIQSGTFRGYDEQKPEGVSEQWTAPVVVKADAEGRFTLPTEIDLSAGVAAIHEDGVCHMRYTDLVAQKTMKLLPWGRLIGAVKVGSRFDANEPVSVHMSLLNGYTDPVCFWQTETSDEDGRVEFNRVPPGSGGWQLQGFIPRDDNPSFNSWERPVIPEAALGNYNVKSGATTQLVFGGKSLGAEEMQSRSEYRFSIDAAGNIRINGKQVEFEDLPELDKAVLIVINPSRDTNYQDVIRILEKYQTAGHQNIHFSLASVFYPEKQ